MTWFTDSNANLPQAHLKVTFARTSVALLTQRPGTAAPRLEYGSLVALTGVTFVQTRDSLCRVGDQRLAGSTSSASGGLLELYSGHAMFMKDLPLLGELGNTSSFRDF